MEKAKQVIRQFIKERDWDQFHSPAALSRSIVIEASELLECFQWSDEYDQEKVCEELADVLIYCIQLCDKLDVDMEEIILDKMRKNAMKYPIDKSKGNSKKYNEL